VSVLESGSTIRRCRPTSASRGIGAEIARTFVGAATRVVLAARKADALQQLAAELGPAAHPFAAHTGKEAGCVALVLVVDGGTTMT
jgi:NADP-dependent 3-hydroxy acid dehydrogenase YdfG